MEPTPAKPAAARLLSEFDIIEPVGPRLVIRPDEPANPEQLPATGRVVALSRELSADPDQLIKTYDRVLYDPQSSAIIELDQDNRLQVIHVESVLAVFRRSQTHSYSAPNSDTD